MKKAAVVMIVALMAVVILAPVAMAQENAPAAGGRGLSVLAVAIGMGAAAFGCGLGQGRIASAACEGMARNPAARPGIQLALILGLAFIESLVLFIWVMIFLRAV